MRAFQDAGHIGVLIVGDYTTRIGDPSGRSSERPILSDEEIDANAKRYVEQAALRSSTGPEARGAFQRRVARKARLRRDRAADADVTVAGILERDDFRTASQRAQPISVSELLYPLMQALRLGRGRGGRRARRHRSALQPAHGPRRAGGVRAGAAGRAHDAAPPRLGRREDELVEREQHRPDRRRPRSSSAGRCGSPTSCCPSGTGSCSSRTSDPPPATRCEAKLALARFIVDALARGGGGGRGGGAFHARRARGEGARRGARSGRLGRRRRHGPSARRS